MKHIFSYCMCVIVYIGLVDHIEQDYASVEITAKNRSVEYLEIPTLLFPCEIKEGDFFYFLEIDGITEIRCGEPPE